MGTDFWRFFSFWVLIMQVCPFRENSSGSTYNLYTSLLYFNKKFILKKAMYTMLLKFKIILSYLHYFENL